MADHVHRITRRGFLAATVASAVAACTDSPDSTLEPARTSRPSSTASSTTSTTSDSPTSTVTTSTTVPAPFRSDPFTLGIASGDPTDDAVILWTRLRPDDELPPVDIDLVWEVALDADFVDVVASGSATAIAALGHSVHVDATGLSPDTRYHYRFVIGEFISPSGTTRTFAAAGTLPERFRFAFSSCQRWEHGFYAAYRDVVERDQLDAFVFLGDYIYETTTTTGPRSTGQDFEAEDLEQYRARYALYRSDPLLQAAHAAVPWIITWDDHEVENDYAGQSSAASAPLDDWLERRAQAYQAWYEFMPVRLPAPTGPDYPIHRTIAHGDLVAFHVLDTRQYRSDQQRREPFLPPLGAGVQVRDDDLQFADGHTMLGAEQFDWLVDRVRASGAVWDVLAQQVFMFGGNALPGTDPPVVVVDTWDGYSGERQRLLDALAPLADNLIVITGDFHSAAVAELRPDPFEPGSPAVGVEFMASSISSVFFDDSPLVATLVKAALEGNPQVRFYDTRRGYTLCDLTPQRWIAEYRAVVDAADASSAVETISTWELIEGTPRVNELA